MSKFKVGDKVIILCDDYPDDKPRGSTQVITSIDDDGYVVCDKFYFWVHEVLLVDDEYTRILEKCAGPDVVKMAKVIMEIMGDDAS